MCKAHPCPGFLSANGAFCPGYTGMGSKTAATARQRAVRPVSGNGARL